MFYKHSDLNSTPQYPCKKPSMTTHVCSPNTDGWRRWVPQSSLSISPNEVLFSEGPCLKTFRETDVKTLHTLPVLCTSKPRHVHLHAPHTCTTCTCDKNTSKLVENGKVSSRKSSEKSKIKLCRGQRASYSLVFSRRCGREVSRLINVLLD